MDVFGSPVPPEEVICGKCGLRCGTFGGGVQREAIRLWETLPSEKIKADCYSYILSVPKSSCAKGLVSGLVNDVVESLEGGQGHWGMPLEGRLGL